MAIVAVRGELGEKKREMVSRNVRKERVYPVKRDNVRKGKISRDLYKYGD